MLRVYKYQLKPSISQKEEIDLLLDKCRDFYNSIIDLDIQHRNLFKVMMTYEDVVHQIKDVKNLISEYDLIHSHILQYLLDRYFLSRKVTFKNYEKRLEHDKWLEKLKETDPEGYVKALKWYKKKYKDRECSPFPRHKSRERFNTICLKQKDNGYKFKDNSKIKFNRIILKYNKARDYEGTVKFCRNF